MYLCNWWYLCIQDEKLYYKYKNKYFPLSTKNQQQHTPRNLIISKQLSVFNFHKLLINSGLTYLFTITHTTLPLESKFFSFDNYCR